MMRHQNDAQLSFAKGFLASIADDVRTPVASGQGITVIVAHPDDETLACGATMARLEGIHLVIVTDGSPRNLEDARANGFDSVAAYAHARAGELEAAVAIANIDRSRLLQLEVADQAASHRMSHIAHELAAVFAAQHTRLALTHAYEGGHPDHDALAFSVHAAAALSARAGASVEVVEMPLYRADADGKMLLQNFAPGADVAEEIVTLGPIERFLKRAMADAHASQARIIDQFDLTTERFRVAPRYDFSQPANAGQVYYERQNWGVRDAAEWTDLARTAARGLELEDKLCARC